MRRDALRAPEARALVLPDENKQFLVGGQVPARDAQGAVVVVQGVVP